MQASARLATAANLGNPTDTFCPFARKTFNAELEWAKTGVRFRFTTPYFVVVRLHVGC